MICGANWRWLISLQTRAWNKQCLIAGDRCYHSPAGLRGAGLALLPTHGFLLNTEKCACVLLRMTERITLFCFLHKATRYKQRVHGRARPPRRAGQLTGGEVTPPERGSFLAGNCTLPCGQILSVDPTGLEFPRKGKEKRNKKKKPQEADRGQRGSTTTGIESQTGASERQRGEFVVLI